MDYENGDETVRIEYEEGRGRYRVTFDPDAVTASLAIVTAMARITGSEPMELPPLAGATNVDVGTVDRLFDVDSGREHPGDASVTCTYLGHGITVRGDGTMTVELPDA